MIQVHYLLNTKQCYHYTKWHSSELENPASRYVCRVHLGAHLACFFSEIHLQLGKTLLSSKSDCDETRMFPRHVFVFIFQRNEDELICGLEEKIDGGRLRSYDITIITCYVGKNVAGRASLCTAENYQTYMSRHICLCSRSGHVTCDMSLLFGEFVKSGEMARFSHIS